MDHTKYSIIFRYQHIELNPNYLQYTNHSCSPNVFFDTARMEVISLRAISAGEEITFFYPSTEWKLIEPFDCACGSEQCLQRIQGAAYLSGEELKRYRLTDYVQEQIKRKQISIAHLQNLLRLSIMCF